MDRNSEIHEGKEPGVELAAVEQAVEQARAIEEKRHGMRREEEPVPVPTPASSVETKKAKPKDLQSFLDVLDGPSAARVRELFSILESKGTEKAIALSKKESPFIEQAFRALLIDGLTTDQRKEYDIQ